MHFKVMASDLNQGLSMVVRAQTGRAFKEEFEGVFIETLDDSVQLTCTDGSLTIRSVVPAVVEKDGSALLPAKLFYDLGRKMTGETDIFFDREQQVVKVHSVTSQTKLLCMQAESFADIKEVMGGFTVTMPQNKFAQAASRVLFALSADETRPILTGCLMEVRADEVRFVCLDGFRLAMQKVYVEHELPSGTDSVLAIVPGAIMTELSRMMEDIDDNITLVISRTHMQVNIGNTTVYAPLIPGEYINYRQIVPASWTTSVKLSRQQMMTAIDRAALIAKLGNNLIQMSIGEHGIDLTSMTEQASDKEQVDIQFDGAPLNIAFNAKYLQEVLKNVDTPEMTMSFNTNVSPCVVRPVSGDQYVYLVLPVRTIA